MAFVSIDATIPCSRARRRRVVLRSDPRTDAHRQLVALLGEAAGTEADDREVAVVAVRLQGRPAMLILATRLLDTMIATRTAERLAHASAKALIRVLREEKRQDR